MDTEDGLIRDKGYFGVKPEGYDATMTRATRGHPLDIRDELRNRRISKKRARIERAFAVPQIKDLRELQIFLL